MIAINKVEKHVLPVADNYAVGTDAYNVILYRRTVNQRGENIGRERWEEVGFFPTHRQALHDMVNVEMLQVYPEYRSMVERIEYLHERIDSLGKTLDGRGEIGKVYRSA